jgi:hypothetical protein
MTEQLEKGQALAQDVGRCQPVVPAETSSPIAPSHRMMVSSPHRVCN